MTSDALTPGANPAEQVQPRSVVGSPVRVPPPRQGPLQTLYHDILIARRTTIEMLPRIYHHINGTRSLQIRIRK